MPRRPLAAALLLAGALALSACGHAPGAPGGTPDDPSAARATACAVSADGTACTDALQRQMDDNRA